MGSNSRTKHFIVVLSFVSLPFRFQSTNQSTSQTKQSGEMFEIPHSTATSQQTREKSSGSKAKTKSTKSNIPTIKKTSKKTASLIEKWKSVGAELHEANSAVDTFQSWREEQIKRYNNYCS